MKSYRSTCFYYIIRYVITDDVIAYDMSTRRRSALQSAMCLSGIGVARRSSTDHVSAEQRLHLSDPKATQVMQEEDCRLGRRIEESMDDNPKHTKMVSRAGLVIYSV